MLKLKKVELLGFKSFCDRTEMQFNGGGIAAIVGPNGCGKSNLSDAISWVLGEQSAKLLRGTRMEDVIFNGSRDRKPLGMAAVTVTLIDPELFFQAPAAVAGSNGLAEGGANGTAGVKVHHSERPGEITVTRRLFRNGESEYLLNGRTCRLRDIQEIFMGTGLGPECYAIIEQGRIGQILSSRPHDRRGVVEEAAGITKFKTKKKLAEAKLESARQNLARVVDILEEVGRQVNSLKRQAAKARRYDELRRELTAKLTVLLSSRYREMERQAVQAALDLNLATEQFRTQSARVEAMESEHATVQKQSFDLEVELQQAREALSSAVMETDRSRQKMEYQARLAEENEGRVRQAHGELAEIERRAEQLDRELATERAAAEALDGETDAVRERLAAKTSELDSLQFHLREREVEQEGLRQRVLALLGEASSLRNQLAQVEEFLAGIERESTRSRAEESAAREELRTLSQDRDALVERFQHQQMELQSLDDRRRGMETDLSHSQQQAQERRERVAKLKEDISRLEARHESLEEILSHRAYTTEAVKNLFAAIEQGRLGAFRPKGILADFVEVDSSHEKAVEEFLRDELEYVVVENWEGAEQGMRLLRAEMEGHATFLVRPQSAQLHEPGPLAVETGVMGRLQEHVRLVNGLAQSIAALLPRLGRCYLVEDAQTARRLAEQYPDRYFLMPDGVCYHGCSLSGGRKTSSGPLALKRELRELLPRLAASTEELERESAALGEFEARTSEQARALEGLRDELQDREKTALASEHELRQINERLHRANSRLSVVLLEIERQGQERQRAGSECERHRQEVDAREQARRESEEALAGVREAIVSAQAAAARATEEQAALRAQLAALEERRKAAVVAAARIEQMLADEMRRKGEIANQVGAWSAERDRLLEDNRRLAGEIDALAKRQQELDGRTRELDAALHQHRARMAEIEEALRGLRQEMEQARERRSAIDVQLAGLQADLRHLEEDCLRELGRPIQEVAAADEIPITPEALAQAEQDYAQLKQKIDALGPVNVLALEEYQEAQQRFDFLDTQRQDLVESIRDTQQAISEIDIISRKQFLEAFEQINQNFRKTFTTLFGGGIGEMRLTDETNIAESGIDIVASPPGKRLQNVLLLSGGEKALTAIALLMAVFQYQPSPFCILDEVDAPLDEANILRFTRLVRDMSDQTQFILITHSKTTMEVAQTLYGVTMEEPGVSKVVSVKFGERPEPPAKTLAARTAARAGEMAEARV